MRFATWRTSLFTALPLTWLLMSSCPAQAVPPLAPVLFDGQVCVSKNCAPGSQHHNGLTLCFVLCDGSATVDRTVHLGGGLPVGTHDFSFFTDLPSCQLGRPWTAKIEGASTCCHVPGSGVKGSSSFTPTNPGAGVQTNTSFTFTAGDPLSGCGKLNSFLLEGPPVPVTFNGDISITQNCFAGSHHEGLCLCFVMCDGKSPAIFDGGVHIDGCLPAGTTDLPFTFTLDLPSCQLGDIWHAKIDGANTCCGHAGFGLTGGFCFTPGLSEAGFSNTTDFTFTAGDPLVGSGSLTSFSVSAPEIDATAATAPIGLLLGALALVVDRRRTGR